MLDCFVLLSSNSVNVTFMSKSSSVPLASNFTTTSPTMIFYHATSLHTAATTRQKRPCCVCFLMFSRLLIISRSRCLVFWICQQHSTASITTFCCSDLDETLDFPRQCLRGRRRLSPAELSNCHTRAAFQLFNLSSMGPTGICPWPHTVCLVYGRNRPNRCSARAQVPSVCRRPPNLRCHVSK